MKYFTTLPKILSFLFLLLICTQIFDLIVKHSEPPVYRIVFAVNIPPECSIPNWELMRKEIRAFFLERNEYPRSISPETAMMKKRFFIIIAANNVKLKTIREFGWHLTKILMTRNKVKNAHGDPSQYRCYPSLYKVSAQEIVKSLEHNTNFEFNKRLYGDKKILSAFTPLKWESVHTPFIKPLDILTILINLAVTVMLWRMKV